MKHRLLTLVVAAIALSHSYAGEPKSAPETPRVTYHTTKVDGLNLFYREAGDPSHPNIVLLHGFPSSSHMFRDLIPKLATKYHVIAPDHPGFGYSDQPPIASFAYTFDHLAEVTDDLLKSLKLDKYSIYIQDYGSPIGFRLFVKHPEKIQAIISQNGNAYDEGLSPFWAENLVPYWKDKTPELEAKLRGFFKPEITQWQYTNGARDAAHLNPDAWTHDQRTLDTPGNADIQLALFYDYQNNVKQYDTWHAALRKHQPHVLAVWGKNDPFFLPAGAAAYAKDVPEAEVHLLETSHFALEEDSDVIANYILKFLGRRLK
jgi:pimeloyl-ACP methyl ester carboxylesterase